MQATEVTLQFAYEMFSSLEERGYNMFSKLQKNMVQNQITPLQEDEVEHYSSPLLLMVLFPSSFTYRQETCAG